LGNPDLQRCPERKFRAGKKEARSSWSGSCGKNIGEGRSQIGKTMERALTESNARSRGSFQARRPKKIEKSSAKEGIKVPRRDCWWVIKSKRGTTPVERAWKKGKRH